VRKLSLKRSIYSQVTGNCGILEAMLTGESNPVTKITDVYLPTPYPTI